jgi:hypothetical protein
VATTSPMEARGCTRLRAMAGYRAARPQPRKGRPVLAIGLIVISAIVVGFVLGTVYRAITGQEAGSSASGSPSTASSPSASAPASAFASASVSASAEPSASQGERTVVVDAPAGLLPSGSVARVLTDGLRMREQASTDSPVVVDLAAGELLLVGVGPGGDDWGPVPADGFSWYPVMRAAGATELPPLPERVPGSEQVGWVAAGDESEPFIELLAPRCPSGSVDLAIVEAMLGWERLACFGDESLTFEGTVGCNGCGGTYPGVFEPGWLAGPMSGTFLSIAPEDRVGPLTLHFAPDSGMEPQPGQIVRVSGHFDDLAARGCSLAPGEPPVERDTTVAELFCRSRFVVESVEVLGTDPDFT